MPGIRRNAISITAAALCLLAIGACDTTTASPSPTAPDGQAPASSEGITSPALTAPHGGATDSPPPTAPTGTPAVGPSLTGSLVCDGTDVAFPADVLQRPANAELAASAPAVALRALLASAQAIELGLPPSGWRVALEAADSVTLIAPGASSWAFVTLTPTPAGWQLFEGGACELRVGLPDAIGFATWRLDPANPPDAAATIVTVLATEVACASGQPPGDRLLPPIVLDAPDAVSIAIAVTRRAGGQDCQGNPEVPVVVQLESPLGSRNLFDASSFPAIQRD